MSTLYYYYYDYIILICIETIDYKRNIIPLMILHKQRRSKQKGLSERRRNLLFLNLAFLSYWSSAVVVVKSFESNTSVRGTLLMVNSICPNGHVLN